MVRMLKFAPRLIVPCLLAAMAAHATGFLTLESSPSGAEIWYTGP